jgi:hypothetical protein
MRFVLLSLLLNGCSNTSYMVPDYRKNTDQYNLMDSSDGQDDPNARIKLIKWKY